MSDNHPPTPKKFLTNQGENTLSKRLEKILPLTHDFDCLVGYFFISGFFRLYPTLESVKKVRILIGLKNEQVVHGLIQIAKICLATGARWSEAEGLRVQQVRNGQIQFTGTKSGKNRSVPIDDALIAELDEHHEQRYGDDSVIAEQYFRFGYAAFRDGVERAGLTLPRGQLTHVLRHTFASHFIMNGGNILVLQKILGHSSLTMTMRYAHLAPEHLQEAKMLNPLARMNG